jgi:tetratricopeptide (TPR) repeat protein
MTHRNRWLGGVAVLALAAGGALVARHAFAVQPYQPPVAMDALTPAAADERDTQIAVWHVALSADTGSALVLGQLAALHAQRARETGQFGDYGIAETYARHSLARRTQRNGATAATLISVLLAQHRFLDAMQVADELVRREPDIPPYHAIRGEVALELGRYDVARESFMHVWPHRAQPAIAPRVARWLEVTGRVPEARRLLTDAMAQVRSRRDVPRESQAWFSLRLGDLEWRSGHARAAAAAYTEGLAVRPGDPRLLTAMALLAAHQQQGSAARTWAERAVAAQPEVTTLLALARASEAAEDTAQARAAATAVATLVDTTAGLPHRDWLLWQLDHGQQVPAILRLALDDLVVRQDVYGFDLVAWALHCSGRDHEAQDMMQRALAMGTRDPLLQRHAAAIETALAASTRQVAGRQ